MSEIANLIAVALTGDEDPAWEAVQALRVRGDGEVFEAASNLFRSSSANSASGSSATVCFFPVTA